MGDKKKILVVDDNPNFAQLLECALEDEFEVVMACDGQQGVDMAGQLRPDIILMDVMMPNVSGIEMARMLTAEEETRNIPLIVLTGSHMDKGVPQLFRQERNVKEFMSKTTPVMEIVGTVKRLLGAA
ncbi:MAG: response regulator [Elusimicrobiales bacterium]|nr:response regulator [Elusimicrobiales bacterium]